MLALGLLQLEAQKLEQFYPITSDVASSAKWGKCWSQHPGVSTNPNRVHLGYAQPSSSVVGAVSIGSDSF